MTAGSAAPVSRRIPGESGSWVFLLGDMLVFAAFFATFMVERSKAPEVFDAARKTLHVDIGLVNTLVLLTSSLFVVGAIGALGLTTGDFLRRRARADQKSYEAIAPRADAVIHIFLPGGIAHQETFDPKPYAPVEYRGELKTIPTKIDGEVFAETLPKTAEVADKICVVRSMTHGEAAHERGTHNMFTGYKPSPDEEYMNPLQLEYFRQRLLQWRAELVEESKQTIENLREEVRDIGDEAERATRETENSLELRTRDRYRKLIAKIDSTLKRIDTGDYGYCIDTGEEIGLERLEARLTAERTIDAQERWEHLQKQMGE